MNRKTEAFKRENLIILIILIIVFLITISIYLFFSTNIEQTQISNSTVTRIIDGDTFELSSGEIIRLLCINTPEKNNNGYEEAKIFLSNLILGKQVILEKGNQDKDKYGRLLRFAYLKPEQNECLEPENNDQNILESRVCFSIGEDKNILVNKEIIKQGFGTLFEYNNENCEKVR